ncbi:MAG: hypothetical protein DWP98_02770 [Bacteroidetes bacterium]|nr:MAG: hypothetical protein DWP98_02770 [Bacteroidota bacterium]MCB0803067.1 hypothetical protein [Flavobacteriales bacterium]
METNISEISKKHLLETSRWANFLAILSFIFIGIILIAGVFVGFAYFALDQVSNQYSENQFSSPFSMPSRLYSTILLIVYLIIALIYFFPSYYLYQFANKMKNGLLKNETVNIDEGFSKLKSVFKFWGIYTILALGLYAIIIVSSLVFAIFK